MTDRRFGNYCLTAREALEPFATFGQSEMGTDLVDGLIRDRICDWFGPADFRRAREAYAALASEPDNTLDARMGAYGPERMEQALQEQEQGRSDAQTKIAELRQCLTDGHGDAEINRQIEALQSEVPDREPVRCIVCGLRHEGAIAAPVPSETQGLRGAEYFIKTVSDYACEWIKKNRPDQNADQGKSPFGVIGIIEQLTAALTATPSPAPGLVEAAEDDVGGPLSPEVVASLPWQRMKGPDTLTLVELCPDCGRQLEETSNYTAYCGRKLASLNDGDPLPDVVAAPAQREG